MLGSLLKDIFAPRKAQNTQVPNSGLADVDVRQQEGGSILCFTAGSEGNALTELTKGLLTPLEGRAARVVLFDVNGSTWQKELEEALSEPVWFATAFFAIGQDIAVPRNGGMVNLWESAGIPFLRLYGDTPAYFPDRHTQVYRNSINGYFHRSHSVFHQRWFGRPALSVLLPAILFDPMPLEQVNVVKKLGGKIIFPKNGNSPEQLIDYWRMALPSSVNKALEDLSEESIGKEWIDKEPCLDDRLIQYFSGFGLEVAAMPSVLCFLVAQIDDYVRRVKSTMIAEALLDLPVIIRGRFWEHVDFRGKRASYDSDSDMLRTLSLIDQAPALVDMSPNTQHAPHDRICRAMGRGTAFLTNRQDFLDALLPSPERFSFDFERNAIRTCVERYVRSPQEAVDLGFEQAKVLRQLFREESYIESLLAAVQICTLGLKGRPPGTQNFVDFPPKVFQ